MRTTRTLQSLGTKLKFINIVEYNNQIYEKNKKVVIHTTYFFDIHSLYFSNLHFQKVN